MELLTGEAVAADWVELLRQQVNQGQEATLHASPPARAPLELMCNSSRRQTPSATPPSQAILGNRAASEAIVQQPVAEAA